MINKHAAPLLAPYGTLQNLALAAKVGGGGKGGALRNETQKTKFKVERRKAA